MRYECPRGSSFCTPRRALCATVSSSRAGPLSVNAASHRRGFSLTYHTAYDALAPGPGAGKVGSFEPAANQRPAARKPTEVHRGQIWKPSMTALFARNPQEGHTGPGEAQAQACLAHTMGAGVKYVGALVKHLVRPRSPRCRVCTHGSPRPRHLPQPRG